MSSIELVQIQTGTVEIDSKEMRETQPSSHCYDFLGGDYKPRIGGANGLGFSRRQPSFSTAYLALAAANLNEDACGQASAPAQQPTQSDELPAARAHSSPEAPATQPDASPSPEPAPVQPQPDTTPLSPGYRPDVALKATVHIDTSADGGAQSTTTPERVTAECATDECAFANRAEIRARQSGCLAGQRNPGWAYWNGWRLCE